MLEQDVIIQMRCMVEQALRSCVTTHFVSHPDVFRSMVEYQMGWENGSSTSPGKRLRPLVLLSACHALGVDWQLALPAASAIELVHNFSLVHDDIQDHSTTRRGKPTIWVKWGDAQAINLGDAQLAMAGLEVLKLPFDVEKILASAQVIQNAVFSLTQGQYLDLANEKEDQTTIEEYWVMVAGKTGALFSACFKIAAILAGKQKQEIREYANLGLQLGLIFQVQDDALGIWGNDQLTGKSTDSDISNRKKTYPILFAMQNLPEFREKWLAHKPFSPEDVDQLKKIVDRYEIHHVTTEKANALYREFMEKFVVLFDDAAKRSVLQKIVQDLLGREK